MATKVEKDVQRCCVRVTGSSVWHKYPCSRTAKVERNGKWYCGQHDPEAVKRRQEKSEQRWNEKQTEEAAARIKSAVWLLRSKGYTVIEPPNA